MTHCMPSTFGTNTRAACVCVAYPCIRATQRLGLISHQAHRNDQRKVQEAKRGKYNARTVGGGGTRAASIAPLQYLNLGATIRARQYSHRTLRGKFAASFASPLTSGAPSEDGEVLESQRHQHTFGCLALVAEEAPGAPCLRPAAALGARSHWGTRRRMGARGLRPKDQQPPVEDGTHKAYARGMAGGATAENRGASVSKPSSLPQWPRVDSCQRMTLDARTITHNRNTQHHVIGGRNETSSNGALQTHTFYMIPRTHTQTIAQLLKCVGPTLRAWRRAPCSAACAPLCGVLYAEQRTSLIRAKNT